MSETGGKTSGADSAASLPGGRRPDRKRWLGRIIWWSAWISLYVVILLWWLSRILTNPANHILTWQLELLILGVSLATGLVAGLVVEALIWLAGKIISSNTK